MINFEKLIGISEKGENGAKRSKSSNIGILMDFKQYRVKMGQYIYV